MPCVVEICISIFLNKFNILPITLSLRKMCPYSEFCWYAPYFRTFERHLSVFSSNVEKYGPENYEYGHFSCSVF